MKKTSLILTLTLIFAFGLLFSQKQEGLIQEPTSSIITNPVSKTEFTDNSAFPVKLFNAQYDVKKSNIPYFSESKTIHKNSTVKVSLSNIKAVVLSAEISQKLLVLYKSYLSSEFRTETYYAQSAKDYVAFVKITPYRINAENRIEELVSYNVEWITADGDISVQKTTSATTFTNNSLLANGNWYKIGITKGGIYKIDKTFLTNMGINITFINPKNIRIYGNGGHMLPERNGLSRPDDLQENAIKVVGEADNVFDLNDYVLFYGQETNEWVHDTSHVFSCLNFYNKQNYYSDTTYYYLTTDLGSGKRISDRSSSLTPATNTTTDYDYYDFHEVNTTNFIKSGTEFYGEYFDFTPSYNFSFPIPNLVVNDTITALAKVAARGATPSVYSFAFSGSTTSFTSGVVNLNDYLGDYVSIISNCNKALCNNPSLITFNVTKQTSGTVGWLDKLVFNARRNLIFNNSQFRFRDSRTIGAGNLTNYVLNTNSFSNISVWDVSDITNVTNQQFNVSGSLLDFTMNNDSLREYAVFNGSDYLTPSFVTKIIKQNLHAIDQADYVIVTYPGFLNQAQKLAQIHQEYDGFTSAVVTTDQVYNEFSSGKPDPVAIRDFVRMLYNRNPPISGKEVKYLLLFGDGSYKVKDRYAANNTSMIPAWEVGGFPKDNSHNPTISTVCDDFYGWMDDIEGENWGTALVDVGVGRFPVKNESEATVAVDKVEAYYKKNFNFSVYENESSCNTTSTYPLGDWRNWVTFIADDEDNQTHMSDADQLANKIKTNHPEYNIDKLYADAFLQYSTPGGQRYYDVSSGIDHRVQKGTLILNYTGHGGEVGLGHERFLEISQIQSYTNKMNMPLFITATCEFSRFDDPDRTSAGELCFLNPNGAAIALLTTVRLAFSNTNFTLNSSLYDCVFDTLPNGKMPCLGDVVRITKRKSGISFYYLNFHLLGDPALKLAYPEQRVYTSQINNKIITPTTYDTLTALSKVTVKGFVGDKNGNKLTSFNGILYPTVFDKEQQITCLGNDPGSLIGNNPFKFYIQKNIIYKGKVQVNNGDFVFSFIVPKDISYNFDIGKLSYYAHNGIMDANGYNKNFYVGGSSTTTIPDNAGPGVNLFLNDKKFVSGGTTNEKPNLYAEVTDSSGINTVGTGIGHDLTAILDENSSKPIILNDYYEADLNSYQSGKVKYPFDQLTEGSHRLSLKVWDVQNNSNTAYTDFVVAPTAEIALTHVLNYPNPFTTRTKFFFENNQCCQTLKVNIQIFTISGKVVKTIMQTLTNEGFRSDGIDWDGKDEFGDKLAKGVYVYKLSVVSTDNKKAEKIEKLVILN